MFFRHAKKLHNEDEVTVKKTGLVTTVNSIVINKKEDGLHDENFVLILCDDGKTYHHTEVR
ncbi:MAG: hypothetical protein IJ419_11710 [Agathobacter sp.]|nr:hypothetical protein [Agathobacter sp.]